MKLNCEIVKDIYLLYKEEELSSNVKKAVEEHLDDCTECKTYYAEQAEYSSIIEKDNQLIEPSKKLDEKLKLKFKLRRVRIVLIFILSVFLLYSYFNYIDQRKSLLYELKQLEQSVGTIGFYLDKDNINDLSDESSIIPIKSKLSDIVLENQRIERNLNYFERKQIEDNDYALNISHYFALFIDQMELKSLHGELTYEDKVALFKMERYFIQYEELLSKEIANLEAIEDKTNIKAIFNTLNIEELSKLTDEISQLSLTYYKYNKLPEQIKLKSEQEIEKILIGTFDTSDAEIILNYGDEIAMYSFEVKGNDKHIYGGIDAYTGQLINFINESPSTEGNILSEDEALNKLNTKLKLIFGDDLDYKITDLGLNYTFDRNNEVKYDYNFNNSEDVKLYTYQVTPIKDGYEINSQYIVRVDARTGDLVVMFSDYGYNTKLFDKSIEFNVSKTIIDFKDGYPLIADDEDSHGDKIVYEYVNTLYIRSKISGNYELVHQYNSTPFPMYTKYINAETGQEDFLY